MKVIWSRFAYVNLLEIYTYHVEFAGVVVAKKMKVNIFKSTKRLFLNPKAGRKEPSLEHIPAEHRYIVCGNYKIIYKEVNEGVLITDVFDTRQNPKKMKRPSRNLE